MQYNQWRIFRVIELVSFLCFDSVYKLSYSLPLNCNWFFERYAQSYTTWVLCSMVRPLGKLLHCLVPRPCYLPSQFVFVQVVLSTKHSHHLTAGVRAVKKPSTIGDKLLREFSSNRVHRRTKQSVPPPSLYSKLGHGVCCSLQVAVTAAPHCLEGLGFESFNLPEFWTHAEKRHKGPFR